MIEMPKGVNSRNEYQTTLFSVFGFLFLCGAYIFVPVCVRVYILEQEHILYWLIILPDFFLSQFSFPQPISLQIP